MMRAYLAWVAVIGFLLQPAHAALPERPIHFDEIRGAFLALPSITEGTHDCRLLDTLLAANYEQRARGLMFVREMPRNAGMLFIYDRPRRLSMWMKNTLISLDIVFLDADGVVINVARGTTPLSLDSISAEAPARFVLELNAGVADEIGLVTGQQLYVPEL